jgi:hypothetical protein
MSRAQWLAFGSTLTMAGCTGRSHTLPALHEIVAETGVPDDSAANDALSDDDVIVSGADAFDESTALEADDGADDWPRSTVDRNDADVADASRDGSAGTFLCGYSASTSVPCDQATQFCFHENSGSNCVNNDATSPSTMWRFSIPPQCAASRTCDCLAEAGWVETNPCCGGCFCSGDDAGTLTIACGGCYGSPPARLERLGVTV